MNQEAIAGMVLCAMGLAMLLISPNAWWKAAEKWKTKDGGGLPEAIPFFCVRWGWCFSGPESLLP